MKRSSGVLLNISSLPGEFGIGSFSIDAKNFIEYIASMGFHWWQTLPLTTIGKGNSPYSRISAFAGNFLYIDPYSLQEEMLITEEEINELKYKGNIYLTDYDYAYSCKKSLLEKAYSKISDSIKKKVHKFHHQNSYWLDDYALYMVIKEKNNNKPWYEWNDNLKFRHKDTLHNIKNEYKDRIEYYYYEQYEFFRQWNNIKSYANELGVSILGDMPIYVYNDSVDVWAHPELFQLDKDLNPQKVAGVPPDYFSKEGQLWGNPLYDYAEMKKDNYSWLIKRILHNLKLYDMLRIDHFRGFYKYWAVPFDSSTAKNGKWLNGPKMEIWNELKKKIKNPNIIVEDLGIIDNEVIDYLKQTGFYGMRVMQFGFDGSRNNIHLPHNYPKECVGYTSTHDNNTTLGWLFSLDKETREYALEYVNCKEKNWADSENKPATKAFIRCLLSSSCNLAIVPMQDLCAYGSDTRMNTPGNPEGNWVYRTNHSALEKVDRRFFMKLNNLYERD